jgi:hypothetical protein
MFPCIATQSHKRFGTFKTLLPPNSSPANLFLVDPEGHPNVAFQIESWVSLICVGLIGLFNLWMIIDAIRKREWTWVLILFLFPGVGTLWYFFHMFRGSTTRGFELPGADNRRRIRELQAQIYHLDKAHHHSLLGDVYFRQGKLDKAEACYRAALERDPKDIDTRAHYGQCLLRLKRPAEARPLLEGVVIENPKHDYSHTMMALAETLTALGETDNALLYWQHIIQHNTYPRAKVQLAELYAAKNQLDKARAEVKDVLADDPHIPAFQRKRDRIWLSRARALARKLS